MRCDNGAIPLAPHPPRSCFHYQLTLRLPFLQWLPQDWGCLPPRALWAVHRYPALLRTVPAIGTALKEALGTGLLMAESLSLIGGALVLLAVLGRGAVSDLKQLALVIPGYFVVASWPQPWSPC